MNNLPPLPDRGHGMGYNADQMKAYASAAIEANQVPTAQPAEAVMYQERTDLRGPYSSFQGWTDWRECDKAQHDMIKSHPTIYFTAEARALVVATTQPQQSTPAVQPAIPKTIAWARRWHVEGIKPTKERNENGRMAWHTKFKFMPITPVQCLPDDVPLIAAINPTGGTTP